MRAVLPGCCGHRLGWGGSTPSLSLLGLPGLLLSSQAALVFRAAFFRARRWPQIQFYSW
jgi:hypothetical protein